MKLVAPARALADAVAQAAQICAPGASLVAYTGVLLEVAGNKLTVRGSDGDTSVAATIKVNGSRDGEVLVTPKPLLAYLTSTDAETPVELEAPTATALSAQLPGSQPYRFTALASPFPTPATIRRDKVAADLSSLRNGLDAVRDCAGSLNSGKDRVVQLVSSEDQGLRLHATDRFRLARAELGTAAGFGTFDGLLPLRVLDLIASMNPTSVQLDPKGRQLVFHADGVVLATRLAQDPYPTVEAVLNSIPPYSARVPRADVVTALRRLRAVGSARSSLRVKIASDQATFSVSNAATGSGTETVELSGPADGEVTFAVSFDYALAAFESHKEDVVSLAWSQRLAPIFFTAHAPVPTTLVVMPMADDEDMA